MKSRADAVYRQRTKTQQQHRHVQHLVEMEEETKVEHDTHRKAVHSLLGGVWARCHGYNIRFKACVDVETTPIVEERWMLTGAQILSASFIKPESTRSFIQELLFPPSVNAVLCTWGLKHWKWDY